MTTPIKPDEIKAIRQAGIPDEVIQIFSDLLIDKYNGTYAKISQDEVVERIVATMDVKRSDIFDKHWLDIEDKFRESGWDVYYDKPPYYDVESPRFIFTPIKTKKKKS